MDTILSEQRDSDFESQSYTTSLEQMNKLKLALRIALESGYASGVFECLLKLI